MWSRLATLRLARETLRRFVRVGGPLVSAATAFYVFLSAAPLMLAAIAVAGLVFGQEAARAELASWLHGVLGAEGTELIMQWVQDTSWRRGGFWASLGGAGIVLFAASRLFAATQHALNQIWGVRMRSDRPWRSVTRAVVSKRLLSFGLVLACGGALTLALAAQAMWRALASVTQWMPRAGLLVRGAETVMLMALLVLVFAAILRVLPDARVRWKDAWLGATVTSMLFVAGALLAGLYAQHVAVNSVYGAAGTLAVVLLWVYYCAQVFFLGATFTHVWAHERGMGVEPEPHAVRMVEQTDDAS